MPEPLAPPGPGTARPVPPRPVTPLGILAAKLHDLRRHLESTDSSDTEVMDAVREACELAGGLDPYLSACTTPESPALGALAERTRAEDWELLSGGATVAPLEQEMLSGHVEGQMLKFLVRATRAERVLEIGMFTGYSALAMAEALPENGTVLACEIDPHAAGIAAAAFSQAPDGHKIVVELGPALDTLRALAAEGRTFDLVFIDADKAGYTGYLSAILDDHLLTPSGVICVDNTLLQGQPYLAGRATANGEAIAAFNRAVAADPRVEQVLVPLRDGLTLISQVAGG